MRVTDRNLGQLAEQIVSADYPAATDTFCALARAGYATRALVRTAIDTAAPFVQAPAHLMMKPDGQLRGVNYDHTILAWRGSLRLTSALPREQALLPLAQAMWYVPQGLDVWDQLLCDFPGHYARDQERCGDRDEQPPLDGSNRFDSPAWGAPKIHFPDVHEPVRRGSIGDRLHDLLQAIMEGDRLASYQLFLGLADVPEARTRLKETILFSGIIDLQDTVINRGGYQNIGHKALRARAMVDLADDLGWENAHSIFYTVVPDLGCTPRFYPLWLMTGNILPQEFRSTWSQLKQLNTQPLSEEEIDATIDTILWQQPGDVTAHITRLLRAGKSLQAVADAIVIAYVRYVLDVVEHPNAFFTPGHAFDYCNVVNHWIRSYDNPHQAKALYFEGLFVNDLIRANRLFPRDPNMELEPVDCHREWAARFSLNDILVKLGEAIATDATAPALALLDEYLQRTSERRTVIATLSATAARIQNDPHIERLCMSSIEEYAANGTSRKDDILRAWTKYLARAIKRSRELGCVETFRRHFQA